MIIIDPATIKTEFTKVNDEETTEIIKNQYGFEAISEFLEQAESSSENSSGGNRTPKKGYPLDEDAMSHPVIFGTFSYWRAF